MVFWVYMGSPFFGKLPYGRSANGGILEGHVRYAGVGLSQCWAVYQGLVAVLVLRKSHLKLDHWLLMHGSRCENTLHPKP